MAVGTPETLPGWGTAVRYAEIPGPVGVVTLDAPGRSVNVLDRGVLGEFAALAASLDARDDLRGLLVTSAKPGHFVAGADLREVEAIGDDRDALVALLDAGGGLFDSLAALPFPTVGLVDGVCLGGGVELLLALDDRLLTRSPRTRVGLPEVNVGLMPAWGGTQRLPRLVGLHHALTLITTGEPVDAWRAVAIGAAFDAVPVERLVEEGIRLLGMLREGEAWRRRRRERSGAIAATVEEMRFARYAAEVALEERSKGPAAAPRAALAAICDGCRLPLREALAVERRAALDLFGTSSASALIGLFFDRQRRARGTGVADRAIGGRTVARVGVVGAGQMGAGIAAVAARSGIPVSLVDVDEARVAAGVSRARGVMEGRVAAGRATPADLADMLARLSTGTDAATLAGTDLVVEAVTEDEGLKVEVLRRIADVVGSDAIVATNTSTIPISRLAAHVASPRRFVGMHFFNPVDRMELVEVIRGDATDDATVATVVGLARRLGKLPLVVRDGPGFLVNRLLFPSMNEALVLLAEGIDAESIDAAAVRFGMPMGPIALHDLVGLDTCLAASAVMAHAFPGRAEVAPLLETLVARGRLGRKSGAGFRRFDAPKGRPRPDPDLDAILAPFRTGPAVGSAVPGGEAIADRLFLPMLLEATRVLEEGIVSDPLDIDLGVTLGLGFPAWRGGILRWCDTEGIANVAARLAALGERGGRFAPSALFTDTLRRGGRFRGQPGA